jgi:hypothetical protein
MKPKTLAASFHSELNEFVDNLDDLLTYTFSDLFFTRSATFLGTPLDGHETLGGYTMIDYLSMYISQWT